MSWTDDKEAAHQKARADAAEDRVKKLEAALEEHRDVLATMFQEDGWPPERLAPRLKRLEHIARRALIGESAEPQEGS
jgi:hypothetical protein